MFAGHYAPDFFDIDAIEYARDSMPFGEFIETTTVARKDTLTNGASGVVMARIEIGGGWYKFVSGEGASLLLYGNTAHLVWFWMAHTSHERWV